MVIWPDKGNLQALATSIRKFQSLSVQDKKAYSVLGKETQEHIGRLAYFADKYLDLVQTCKESLQVEENTFDKAQIKDWQEAINAKMVLSPEGAVDNDVAFLFKFFVEISGQGLHDPSTI